MTLLHLFFIFFYIGLFAVGGGLVAATFMQQELVEHYHLITAEKFYNMLAISESTPGPIGINMATYAGFHAAGLAGGIAATLSLVLPSLIVIVIIAKILDKFNENPYVKSSFAMIRPVVTGLIATAVCGIFETALFTASDGSFQFPVFSLILCALFFIAMNLKKLNKIHPFFWMVAGAVVGLVFQM